METALVTSDIDMDDDTHDNPKLSAIAPNEINVADISTHCVQ